MIKLIASDLDGTLLHNGAQKLTPRAIELIHELTQKGVHFVAASGRQYDNERRLFSEIKDEISYIGENGSICIHQGKVISRGIIADDLQIAQLRVEYKKAAVLGDMIYPKLSKEADRIVVELCDEQAKPYAVLEFKEEI